MEYASRLQLMHFLWGIAGADGQFHPNEINIIEIIWRKIKYEWLPFSAYQSLQALQDALFDVLANIGKRYHTKFA